jgi:hypothetical protein
MPESRNFVDRILNIHIIIFINPGYDPVNDLRAIP